jgi:HEAT repeat protein
MRQNPLFIRKICLLGTLLAWTAVYVAAAEAPAFGLEEADALLAHHRNPEAVSPLDVQDAIRILAADPAQALPVLEARGEAMVFALQAVGSDATPVLSLYIDSSATNLVRRAFDALRRVGTAEALPVYERGLEYGDDYVETSAGLALRRAGVAALPAALRACQHPQHTIRMQAYYTVGMLGEQARSTVPDLLERLETDLFNRRVILRVLSQVGGEAVIAPMVEVLVTGNALEQQSAAQALGEVDPPARKAIPALVEVLATTNATFVEKAAAGALERLGALYPADLEPFRKHTSARVRALVEKVAPPAGTPKL